MYLFYFALDLRKCPNSHHFIGVSVRCLSPWIITSTHYTELGGHSSSSAATDIKVLAGKLLNEDIKYNKD